MKTRTIVVYNCEHCNKLYQVKSACERHEIKCTKNTANHRACMNCIHLDKKEVTQYFDTYCGDGSRKVNILFCEAKNICVYPPMVDGKQLEDLDFDNEPMPTSCDLQQLSQPF